MNLSSELISQFVKITKDDKPTDNGSTVYGTIVEYEGTRCVKLDGSDQITPITSTADVLPGDRVAVHIKNHTATVTGNMTSPSARKETVDELGEDVKEHGDKISEFELVVADMVTTEQLNAAQANIELLIAEKANISDLEADRAEIDELLAKKATIEQLEAVDGKFETLDAKFLTADAADIKYASIDSLEAVEGKFNNLEATFAEFEEVTTTELNAHEADINKLNADVANIDKLYAKTADIENLYATKAEVELLEADVADIDTLIFGSASGTTIQTSFANAVIAQLGNAQIKSAMINSLDASKINAGTINTNNVNIQSDDGKLVISDETIQISDDTRVRVQIGKDASNDYSISIWDANGKLMFSEGGITDNAIKEAIIRNDMVSDDANISASKLNISSLFTEINNSTQTINSSKILLDADNQTLDVAFTKMSSDVGDLTNTVSSQGTALSVVQGKIDSKVWQQDIDSATDELGNEIESLNTKQSTFEQTLNGISTTVSSHTTQIANKADNSTVTTVSNKVTALETNLDGFKSTVSETYATKNSVNELQNGVDSLDGEIDNLSNKQSTFEQTINGISTTVSEHTTQIAKKADSSTVTTVSNKVTQLETGLEGFKSSVSQTYQTKADMSGYSTTEEMNSAINQKADEINLSVSSTYTTKSEFEDLEVGARNLIRNSVNLIFEDHYFGSNGEEVVVVSDENGNVMWLSPETEITDDGDGDIEILNENIAVTNLGNGELLLGNYAIDTNDSILKTLTIGNVRYEIVDSVARERLDRLFAASISEVTLLASKWTGTSTPYAQVVNITGVTENSQVDLTPDVNQLSIFYEKDLTFVTENDGGVVTVYAIGQKPENDYVIQVTITEVNV